MWENHNSSLYFWVFYLDLWIATLIKQNPVQQKRLIILLFHFSLLKVPSLSDFLRTDFGDESEFLVTLENITTLTNALNWTCIPIDHRYEHRESKKYYRGTCIMGYIAFYSLFKK